MSATFDVQLPRTTVPPRVGWFSFVLVCNVAGLVGPALVDAESLRYAMLERPAFAPPWWIFAPVWLALYTLMGTATYLVWRRCTWERQRTAMRVLAVQLALHAAWTPVFFGLGQIFIAFLLLIASWLTVGAMALVYACRVPLAGALLLPLWIWGWFAMVLNGGIWWLNRSC